MMVVATPAMMGVRQSAPATSQTNCPSLKRSLFMVSLSYMPSRSLNLRMIPSSPADHEGCRKFTLTPIRPMGWLKWKIPASLPPTSLDATTGNIPHESHAASGMGGDR
jgi:hypothetical protein